MPKKTPLSHARKWLERLEAGETEAQIARSERKDPRTVTRAMEEVRRERDMSAIRREALKEAFRRHQDQLLDLLANVQGSLELSPQDINLLAPGSRQPEVIRVLGNKVRTSIDSEPKVTTRAEDSLPWQLLREHLVGDPLWRQWEAWKRALYRIVQSHLALSDAVADALSRSVKSSMPPESAHQVYRLAIEEAVSASGTLAAAAGSVEIDDATDQVSLYSDDVSWSFGKGPELLQELRDVMTSLAESNEVVLLRSAYQATSDASRSVRQTVDLIRAGWYVPGKCQACDRLKR